MKEFIKQFYNEGFATTFIKKPERFLKKHIKNKKMFNLLMISLLLLQHLCLKNNIHYKRSSDRTSFFNILELYILNN